MKIEAVAPVEVAYTITVTAEELRAIRQELDDAVYLDPPKTLTWSDIERLSELDDKIAELGLDGAR